MPQELLDNTSWDAVSETCNAIETLEPGYIEYIVNRIPDTFLKQTEKTILISGLVERRTLIRPVLKNELVNGRSKDVPKK